VQATAMGAELLLSEVNHRRLGPLGDALDQGRAGRLFRAAKWLVRAGLGLQARGRGEHLASACHLAAGLCFRYAWVAAGPPSARDDEAVARMARTR